MFVILMSAEVRHKQFPIIIFLIANEQCQRCLKSARKMVLFLTSSEQVEFVCDLEEKTMKYSKQRHFRSSYTNNATISLFYFGSDWHCTQFLGVGWHWKINSVSYKQDICHFRSEVITRSNWNPITQTAKLHYCFH